MNFQEIEHVWLLLECCRNISTDFVKLVVNWKKKSPDSSLIMLAYRKRNKDLFLGISESITGH